MCKEEKAQLVMIDFMGGLFIFMVILGYVTTVWAVNFSAMENNYRTNEMHVLAFQTAELLVKSRGKPENWEELAVSDINAIGLASSDRVIDEQKLNRFKNMGANYEAVKQLLHIANYDFYFELEGSDDANAGLPPASESQRAVVRRIVNYKGGEAIVSFTLYKLRP